jgi:hypothetical protein
MIFLEKLMVTMMINTLLLWNSPKSLFQPYPETDKSSPELQNLNPFKQYPPSFAGE